MGSVLRTYLFKTQMLPTAQQATFSPTTHSFPGNMNCIVHVHKPYTSPTTRPCGRAIITRPAQQHPVPLFGPTTHTVQQQARTAPTYPVVGCCFKNYDLFQNPNQFTVVDYAYTHQGVNSFWILSWINGLSSSIHHQPVHFRLISRGRRKRLKRLWKSNIWISKELVRSHNTMSPLTQLQNW